MRHRAGQRRRVRFFLTLAFALCACTLRRDAAGQTQPVFAGSHTAAAAPADTTFRKMTQHLIQEELRLHPEEATDLGDHRYDDRVNDMSRAGIAKRIEYAK